MHEDIQTLAHRLIAIRNLRVKYHKILNAIQFYEYTDEEEFKLDCQDERMMRTSMFTMFDEVENELSTNPIYAN